MQYNRIIYLVLSFLISINSYSQGEGNIWYFGGYAGLDFNTVPASALIDGAINTQEGVATISSASGDLLFYTDGVTVFNSMHQIMLDGTGLFGHYSSTQSAVIVPKPQSDSIYYIFTVDELGGGYGLRYSEVDMTLDGGLGGITINKNIPLITPVCEKITAVLHNNYQDIWVITHGWNSNSFHVFLVDSLGVNLSPVNSAAGSFHAGATINSVGYMKASPSGSSIALVNRGSISIDIFDFDNITGEVSTNFVEINALYQYLYGLEFSPNGDYLYVGWSTDVVRYDLTVPAIQVSQTIDTLTNNISFPSSSSVRALQVATDGNIYVSLKNYDHIAQIVNPNSGADTLIVNGIYLDGKICKFGLPSFIQTYFNNARISSEGHCENEEIQFSIYNGEALISVNWNFDDSTSSDNNSSIFNPVHIYSQSGTYEVSLELTYAGFIDTIYNTVIIYDAPNFTLGNDTAIVIGDTLVLELDPTLGTFDWSTGDVGNSINVNLQGLYSVTITNEFECNNADSIYVTFYNSIINNYENEVIIYPNPASDILKIECPEVQTTDIKIFDIEGREIFRQIPEEKNIEINVSSFDPGFYFVVIYFNDYPQTYKICIR